MESNNNSSKVGDFEHVNTNNTDAELSKNKRKRHFPKEESLGDGCQSAEDSSNFAEQLSKIREEFDAVKTENTLLVAKVDWLQAQNGEFHAKLNFVEMEAKLANKQMAKTSEARADELNAKLEEEQSKFMDELRQKYEGKLELLTSKMTEENTKLKNGFHVVLQENQQKFSELLEAKIADKDEKMESKLEQMVKHLDQGMADFGGKITALESQMQAFQQIIGQQLKLVTRTMAEERDKLKSELIRLNEFALKLTSLELKEGETRKGMGELHKHILVQIDERDRKMCAKMELLTGKMAEGNDKLRKECQDALKENQLKFNEQQAKKADLLEKKLEKMSKQLDDNAKKVTVLERQQSKSSWSTNQWDDNYISATAQKHVRLSADGLVATAENDHVNVRAQQPISREILASFSAGFTLVYYELLFLDSDPSSIGWANADFPLNGEFWLGEHPGTHALYWTGNYWASGLITDGHAEAFSKGDVVGTGLFLARNGQFKIFFTKSGRLNGKPVPLDSQDQLLSPTVSFDLKNTSVEANFGVDYTKPFKFDISAHKAQLFD